MEEQELKEELAQCRKKVARIKKLLASERLTKHGRARLQVLLEITQVDIESIEADLRCIKEYKGEI